jgi:ABC-type transport system involved in multi-copper enzyme maturation permease subunit
MIWLTWRQFRIQAAAVYAAVVAFAIVLTVTGPRLFGLDDAGANVFDQLTRFESNLYFVGLVVVAATPAIVGAFWGAPMVARELEAGTHRLVWTQSVTRTRWLATKLGVTALATVAAVGVLTLAVSWWAGPIDGITGSARGDLPARLTPVAFAMRGIVPIGYAVFALALGVGVGVLLRRTVPAMAVTLVLFTFVQIAVPLWIRPHLVSPVRQTVTISESNFRSLGINGPDGVRRLTVTTGNRDDWVLSNETIDASGQVARTLPAWIADCLPPPRSSGTGRPSLQPCFTRLTDLGYRQQLVFQPAHRFWPLQWAETALFLGLAGLLTWFSFWWTRHRLA